MSQKNWDLTGCLIPIITPFTGDHKLDGDGLRRLTDFLIDQQGASAIIPCGTTGESPTLTHEEHTEVIRIVKDQVAGRVPVIAGTGSNSTREAIELTEAAAEIGVDGTLQVGPYYNRPSQEGMYRHFKAIAEAVDLPMIIYNIPIRTGRNIEPETIIRLSEIDNIVGLKDASGDILQGMAILRSTRGTGFHVYAGEDALTFSLLCLGGHGAVAAIGHVLGREVRCMVELVHGGRVEEAREIHYRIMPAIKALFVEPNPAAFKQALKWMGQPAGPVRPPLVDMSPKGQEVLKVALIELGKINTEALA
ncbi:MAG: 4-hydroxy-tetrahydrodipicolinate synthase [Chloroflexi bacterium]|nr:4-hydroxy-tetrahydrodipicolinate synthase [Chloroflexota bacterium]